MKKIKEIILLLFVIIVSLNFPVLAEETDNLEVALNTVKESTYFRDYENSINSMDILRESETESGIRYTVRFLLDEESEEHTLIFVLNDNFNIIEALEIEFLEDRMIAVDLQKNFVKRPKKTCQSVRFSISCTSCPGGGIGRHTILRW